MSNATAAYLIAATTVGVAFAVVAGAGERLMHWCQVRRDEKARRLSLAVHLAELRRQEDEKDYRDALSQEDWDYKYLRRRTEDG